MPNNSSLKRTGLVSRLESKLQTLVEGVAGNLFSANDLFQSLSKGLEAALRNGIYEGVDGELLAPNLFAILLPAAQFRQVGEDNAFADSLASHTLQIAEQMGVLFPAPLVIRVIQHPDAGASQVEVQTGVLNGQIADTSVLEVDSVEAMEVMEGNAYLVVNGLDVFPLDQPLITIGRDPENHLVLDDPRVSRLHAQLRLVQGHFVIFDLDSTGGTFVNGQMVSQHTLVSGDLLSIAGIPLVFSEEHGSRTEKTTELVVE
ncbi:MAG: DUF3662 domain-containing protein [Anaerolineales bacterium]|nr:DUF3662 domain-containing protein [Anaerolineales bacterium]